MKSNKKAVRIDKGFEDYLNIEEIYDYMIGLDGGKLYFRKLGVGGKKNVKKSRSG